MDVKLPDGRVLKNVPEGTTKAQIAAKLGISETGQTNQSMGLSPAQEFQNEQPLIRTLGRGGRAVASGLSSIADLALLPVKTAALAAGLGAEKMGATEVGRGLQRIGQIPTMADTTRTLVDQATGDRLKPTGFWDKAGDFSVELIASAAPFAKGDDLAAAVKSPTVKDAVTAVLNPQKTAERIFVNKYPVPEKITTQAIANASRQHYADARKTGASFKDEIARELSKTVDEQRILDPFAKEVLGSDEIDSIAEGLKSASKHKMNLESFEALDKRLGALANKAFRSGDDDLVRRYDNIQDKLRELVTDENFIEGTDTGIKSYRDATKLWAVRAKSRDIDQILEHAQTYVGGEAAGIKAGFTRLLKSKKFAKYSPDEKKIIEKVAKTGKLDGPLAALSSRLLTIGGAVKGGPAGALAGYAANEATRAGATALKKAKVTQLEDLLFKEAGKIDSSLLSTPAGPLLTNQGVAALLSTTNAAGQKLLPKPSDPVALGRLLAQ